MIRSLHFSGTLRLTDRIRERVHDVSTAATTAPPVPTSHPKGFYFLFAGEFAERFSFYGMRAILPLYMSDQLGFGEGDGGRYYTFFLAACYLLPLLGGWVADNFFGKYWKFRYGKIWLDKHQNIIQSW